MNANLDVVLSRLTKVRGRNGSWVACCPAHEDRSPSMTVTQKADGKILMHCFAGCSIGEIAEAIGIDLSDLFPPREDGQEFSRPLRHRFIAADLLKVIADEALVVSICASDLAKGIALSCEDRRRLNVACGRIQEALVSGGAA